MIGLRPAKREAPGAPALDLRQKVCLVFVIFCFLVSVSFQFNCPLVVVFVFMASALLLGSHKDHSTGMEGAGRAGASILLLPSDIKDNSRQGVCPWGGGVH